MISKKFQILAQSQFVRTKPVGLTNQADFVNGALLIQAELSREELHARLKQIEQELGRANGPKNYGPRPIDLDILVCNDTVVNEDFYERDFIKDCVLELLPRVKY